MPDLQMPLHRNERAASDAGQLWNMIQGRKDADACSRTGRRWGAGFWSRICQPGLFPVNELAMEFPSKRVDNGYLKVLIVAQAVVAEMLRKLFAVRDSLKIAIEVDPDPIS